MEIRATIRRDIEADLNKDTMKCIGAAAVTDEAPAQSGTGSSGVIPDVSLKQSRQRSMLPFGRDDL